MAKKPTKRDPLEKFSVPMQAGASGRLRTENAIWDRIGPWLFLAGGFFMLFFVELWAWFWELPRNPWIYLFMALAATALLIWRVYKILPEIRAMKLGVKGEMAVGHLLEDLRSSGFFVLHDLDCGKGGNIDHIVIGPPGVFAIETKTFSKPGDQSARIKYDGRQLTIPGVRAEHLKEKDPIRQAQRVGALLNERIKQRTGRKLYTKPVVLFPGWWVDENPKTDVWVMNPERFIKYVCGLPEKMSADDRAMIYEGLLRKS